MPDYVQESLCIKDYKIYQSKDLYRFTSDAVLLSRFAPHGANAVADLCSGSGIVGLHYYALNDVSVQTVTLCEIQSDLADMSRASVALNGLDGKFSVVCGRLQDLTERERYDLVLCNPPYKKSGSGYPLKNESLALCRYEIAVTFDEICSVAAKLLKRNGAFCACNAVDRLSDVLASFERYSLSPSRLRFVSAKEGGEPYLFLIEGVKGRKASLKIEPQTTNSSKNFSGV